MFQGGSFDRTSGRTSLWMGKPRVGNFTVVDHSRRSEERFRLNHCVFRDRQKDSATLKVFTNLPFLSLVWRSFTLNTLAAPLGYPPQFEIRHTETTPELKSKGREEISERDGGTFRHVTSIRSSVSGRWIVNTILPL